MFEQQNKFTVYGPVKSWRFGMSVGIDPIFITSTCSFNCIYCQLGKIQNVTNERSTFVSTQRIIDDFKKIHSNSPIIDVICYSGSGEPTLALNLEEIIDELKMLVPNIEQSILTNGTQLHDPQVRMALHKLDKVTVKLDANNDKYLQKLNRPVTNINHQALIDSMIAFRNEYRGKFELQVMIMSINDFDIKEFANILKQLGPDNIQINTPKRPYPLSWHRENRGNHEKIFDYQVKNLKTITNEQAQAIANELHGLTGLSFQVFS